MRDFSQRYLSPLAQTPLRILDFGSQDINGSYRDLFARGPWSYVGLDMSPGKNVDIVVRDPYHWKEIPSGSIDVVVSGQAFEHVEYFWMTMLEIHRILKEGGLCCLIAPSAGFEHRYPVDCWRFYPDGFSALARFARLDLLEVSIPAAGEGYADESKSWCDCVFIGRKPKGRGLRGRWQDGRRALVFALLKGLI